MTTGAGIGYAAKFLSADGNSPGTWAEFGEVTNITAPGIAIDAIDVSHEQSPGASREFIPGLVDGGEVSIEFNLVPANASTIALMAETVSRVTRPRRVVYPSGAYLAFNAFLTGFEQDVPLDDKMSGSATYKVTGAVTLVQAP